MLTHEWMCHGVKWRLENSLRSPFSPPMISRDGSLNQYDLAGCTPPNPSIYPAPLLSLQVSFVLFVVSFLIYLSCWMFCGLHYSPCYLGMTLCIAFQCLFSGSATLAHSVLTSQTCLVVFIILKAFNPHAYKIKILWILPKCITHANTSTNTWDHGYSSCQLSENTDPSVALSWQKPLELYNLGTAFW